MTAECIITCVLKNIAGFFLTIFFLEKLADYQVKIKTAALTVVSAVILATVVVPYFLLDLETADEIADFSTLFSFTLIPYCIFIRKKRFTFILFGLILNSVLDLFNETVNYIFGISSITVSNLIFIVFCAIFAFIVFAVSKNNNSGASIDILENVPAIVYIVIFISTLSTYYTMMLPKDSEFTQRNSYILLIGSAFLVIICVIFIILKYISVIQSQNNAQLQIESQLKQYEELLAKNHDIKRFKHDYKNNMFAISSMLDDGKVDDARNFIAQMNTEIQNTDISFATGNYLADAIISYKASVAASQNISLHFEGTIPSKGIANNDLCTVFSNALDNAIEGSLNCAPCTINITSSESGDGAIIAFSNPVLKKINIKNNRITTTKKSKKNHGFGIENIKSVAKKYNGFVTLECVENIFTIKIGFVFTKEDAYV